MRKPLLLAFALALLLPLSMRAQVLVDYTFSTGTDATLWYDMTGSTQILTPSGNDGLASSVQAIGFTFPFGEGSYTQFSVNTDGNLRLGGTVTGTSNYSTPFSSSNASINNPKINGFGCDGYGVSGSHYVKKLLVDDTILVVEFCMGTFTTSTRDNLYKWQVHLFASGNVEIVYPPASGIPTTAPAVARQCGLCTSAADGWTISAAHVATQFTNGTSTTIASGTWPTAGRYYRFTRPYVTCPATGSPVASAISTTGATLTWESLGEESEWLVSLNGGDWTSVYDTTVVLDTLTGNTLYTFAVRALCGAGDTSSVRMTTFRTACVPISSLPYENDFEDEPYYLSGTTSYAEAFPACWTRINDASGTYNYYPYINTSSTYLIHGGKSMYWYHTTTTTYADNEYAVLPPVDLDVYDMSDLTLSFFAKTTATAAPWPLFIVGVMTDPSNAATFVPVDTITLTTTATMYAVNLTNYTGSGAYIAIRCPRPTSSRYCSLDDIYLTDAWCDFPEEVTASSTTDEITISWNANGGTSFTVYCGQDTVTGISDTSYTFSNLLANTPYNYGVANECSSSNSMFITGTIRTQCGAITQLPYTENFDEVTGTTSTSAATNNLPPCWDYYNVGTSTSYSGYPIVYNSSTYAHSGTQSMRFYNYTTAGTYADQYGIMPATDSTIYPMNTLMVNFWMRSNSTTYNSWCVVGVMSDPSDASTFVPVETIYTGSSTTYAQHEVSFANYTGPHGHVTFLFEQPTSGYNYGYVDDVVLREIPNCFWPASVSMEGLSSEGVTLNWIPDSRTANPNGWEVEYGPHGFTLGTGTMESLSDTTLTLTNLTPNTEYDVYISADCGGELSDPAIFTFRTMCVALDTLPYVQNFESAATGTSTTNVFVDCMTRLNNGTQYFGYPYVGSSSTYNHTVGGAKGLYWYNTTTTGTYGDYQIVALPPVDTNLYPINSLQLRFWARPSSTSYSPQFQVGVMTDPNNASTFHQVGVVNVTNNTDWQEFTILLGNYTGTGNCVAIRAMRTTWTAYVDDITLEPQPACPPIVDFEATPSVGSALLTWDVMSGAPGTPSSYVVTYNTTSPAGTPTTMTVTENAVTLTGLTPGTSYKAYVYADCDSDSTGRVDSITFSTTSLGCAVFDTTNMIQDTIGNGTTTSTYFPSYSLYNYGLTQQIYTASEIGQAMNITSLSVMYSAVSQQRTFEIYMGHTSSATATEFLNPSDLTLVYDGGPIQLTPNVWTTFELTTPFNYNGSGNLVIFFRDMTGSYVSGNACYGTNGTSGCSRYVYQDGGAYTVGSTTGGTTSSFRPNIILESMSCLVQAQCAAPSVSVTDIQADEVTIAWAPGYDETAWDVEYRVVGTTTWNTEASSVSVNSYTITGLTPSTDYEFRVGFSCSDGTDYYTTVAATTACLQASLPYTENFDNITTSTSTSNYGLLPNCWDYVLTGSSTYQGQTYEPRVYYSTSNSNSGSYCLYLYGVGYFMLPEMSAPLDSLLLSFNDYISSASYGLIVGVMEGSSFVPIDTVELTPSTHNYVEILLSNYHGTSRTIAFQNYYTTSTSTYYSYHYIDDIRVEYIPECQRPLSVSPLTYTDTSATIVWDSLSNGYEVVLSTTSIDPDSVTNATYANTNNLSFSNLTPNTLYYVYVRTDCGISGYSDWSNEMTFRTACAPLALPYTENFESYGSGATSPISPCWTKNVYGTTTQYPYPYSTNAVSGQRSLYFYSYHPSSATSTPYHCYAALPMFQDSVNRLSLSMNVRRYSTTTDYYTTRLVIGVMTNPDDIATFFPMDTLDLKDAPALSIHGYEFNFNNYTGDGRYIAIYDPVPPLYGTGTYTYSYAYVDDIVVDYIAACPRPSNVVINNITETSATVHWDGSLYNGATFEVEYGPQGFTLGTGTLVTTTDDSIDINGLMASSNYDVYVRALCSATENSNWSFVQHFATVCGAINLPLFVDFEGMTTGTSSPLPTCWTRLNNATGTYNYYPYVYSSTTYAHNSSNCLYFYNSTSSGYPSDQMIVFPQLDVLNNPVNTVELSFWARGGSYNNRKLILGVMTDPTQMSTFVPTDTVVTTTTLSEYTMNTASYTGNGTYVALRMASDTSISYSIYVDDIRLQRMSPCPRAYNLTAYDGTTTTVTLEWADTNAGTTGWMIEYGLLNDSTTTMVNVNSNPYTLTGLTPNTNYRYRVAPYCANGSLADWSNEWHNFGTALNPATLPYNYDFENAAEWANWQTSTSNPSVNWYRGTAAQGNNTNALYLSADGGTTHSWNMNVRTNAVAYRDIDFGTTVGSFQIDFDAYMGGTTSANYDGISVVVTDPAIYVQSQDVNITSPWGNVNDVGIFTVRHDTVWGHHTAYIDGISGVKRVAFYHFNQSTGASYPFEDNPSAIDNIVITQQTCERPYDLTATNPTMSGVTLSWGGDATATYQVAYRVQGAAASTNAYTTVTGNTTTLNGLPAATSYYWWVRKICTLTATDTVVSGFSVNGVFSTLCDVVSVADTLFEDFESYTGVAYNTTGDLPNCWEGLTTGTSGYVPHVTNGSTYSYCISGTNAITMTSGSATYGSDNYMRLVDISEPTNTLTIAFWMCTESSTNGFLEVGYLTGLNYETDFVAVRRINASSATMHSGNGLQTGGHGIFDTVSFENVPAGNFPICFRWNYTSSFYSVCLDDIAVWSSAPSCLAPSVTLVTPGVTSATVNWNGNAAAYEVAIAAGNWVEPTTATTVTGNTYTFEGLTPTTRYSVGIRAVCDVTEGIYSEWVVDTVTTAELPCPAPTGVSVSDVALTGATISWTPASATQNDFEVSITAVGVDTIVSATGTSVTVTGLPHNTDYVAKVRANCGYGTYSDWSDPATFRTLDCQTVTGVTVTETTQTTASVSWTSNGSASYEVAYGIVGTTTDQCARMTVRTNSCVITGLEPGVSYVVYVRSVCAEGVVSEEWSTGNNFTTQDEVGIADVDNASISLYPNPATSTVTLTGIEGEAEVSVVDMNGRQVYSGSVKEGSLSIDVSGLSQGAYFVRVTGEKVNAIRKLIVR